MKYCLVQDEDTHWYLIPASRRSDFEKKCEKAYKTENFDKFEKAFGEYRINGPNTLTFENPEEE